RPFLLSEACDAHRSSDPRFDDLLEARPTASAILHRLLPFGVCPPGLGSGPKGAARAEPQLVRNLFVLLARPHGSATVILGTRRFPNVPCQSPNPIIPGS